MSGEIDPLESDVTSLGVWQQQKMELPMFLLAVVLMGIGLDLRSYAEPDSEEPRIADMLRMLADETIRRAQKVQVEMVVGGWIKQSDKEVKAADDSRSRIGRIIFFFESMTLIPSELDEMRHKLLGAESATEDLPG